MSAAPNANGINDLGALQRWHDSRDVWSVTTDSLLTLDVADTILRYVTAHPDACDSLEGICDWWLVRQQRDDTRRAVAAALVGLVADGRMEASTGADGLTVYRARPAARH